MHGVSPFKEENYKKLFENIVKTRQIPFNEKISDEVVDLIQKLLNKNPLTRIELNEVYEHPWIKKKEKFFDVCINDFRQKVKKLEEEHKKTQKNQTDLENILEEGFSPQNSPTRKLKKKAVFNINLEKNLEAPTEITEQTPEKFLKKTKVISLFIH